MELLKIEEELIEAKPKDISIFWKILQIFFYFLSVISGYGSSILFYILWHDIFAENCPLWAQTSSLIQPRLMPDEEIPIEEEIAPAPVIPDWRQKITITFRYSGRCNFHHFVSLSSCAFGIFWMTLFAMCGKGGYDTRIFVAPWTVVPPAIIFQFIFSIIVMFVVNDLEYGYSSFVNDLQKITFFMNETQLATLKRPCDVLRSYLEIFGPSSYNVCQIYSALRTLSWIMGCSWVFGLIALIFRVIRNHDFTLLTVKIYKIPKDGIEEYSQQRASIESAESI